MKVANENAGPAKESSNSEFSESMGRSMMPPEMKLDAGSAGPIQRMKMDATDKKAHPKFTKFVKNEIPKKANDARIVKNLNKFGTNTGKTKRDIAKDLKWGSGPTVDVTPLSGANGQFSPGIKSQKIEIDKGIVDAYEKAKTNTAAHELLLESTILHEYTHYLDDQDGKDRAGEEGQDFEEANYGVDIDNVSDAADVLKASYGPGKWTVSFAGKEAGYKQRVVVSGAKTGNGTYDGKTGLSKSIVGDKGKKWKIQIQHNDGSGWKNSKMLNVKEGKDNYLLRSEDWTDSDNNDLELRVKK